MHAYVINLARSPDRRRHMVEQLARTAVEYEFVEAVDGRELDLSDAELFDPAVVGTESYRPGAAGCALSHLRVYRSIVRAELEHALVLEDDVVLPDDLGILVGAVAEQMHDAEVALLNFHSEQPCRFTKAGAVELVGSRSLVHLVDDSQVSSTGAYVITRAACERMVETALPLRAQPDDWAYFLGQKALDQVRCVAPMPVTNSTSLRTTIDYFVPGTVQARLRERVASARLPLLHQVLAWRRQRTFSRLGWTGQSVFVDEMSPEGP
jgi:glycosyl transferase family 25